MREFTGIVDKTSLPFIRSLYRRITLEFYGKISKTLGKFLTPVRAINKERKELLHKMRVKIFPSTSSNCKSAIFQSKMPTSHCAHCNVAIKKDKCLVAIRCYFYV